MPNSLRLDVFTSFKDIKKFFVDAGPEAKIGARKNADGNVVLYRRDNLGFIDGIVDFFTLSCTRKENYAAARQLIDSTAKRAAWTNTKSRAAEAVSDILSRHTENFYAREFIALDNQAELCAVVVKGLERSKRSGQIDQNTWNALWPALEKTDPNKVAESMLGARAADEEKRERAEEFKEFRKFMQTQLSKFDPAITIDYAKVVDFEESSIDWLENMWPSPSPDANLFPENVKKALNFVMLDTLSPGLNEVKGIYEKVLQNCQFNQKGLDVHRTVLANIDLTPLFQWMLTECRMEGRGFTAGRMNRGVEVLLHHHFKSSVSWIGVPDYDAILDVKSLMKKFYETKNLNGVGSSLVANWRAVSTALNALLDIDPSAPTSDD